MTAAPDLAERCAAISLLLVDVDGVLTDGVIAIDDRGVETKHFHVRDGTALAIWRKLGRPAAILSGRKAAAVVHRAKELGIAPVIQGVGDKGEPFRGLIRDLGIEAKQVCYVGDDLADLPVLLAAGLAACPSDAAPEVREAAHLVLGSAGGRGAVREVVEVILKHQGLWDDLVARQRIPA
jgi:3-deoxy-D-manno-octulosonate 8-phosphate phosphatase (KDO 8-P phosphatase)